MNFDITIVKSETMHISSIAVMNGTKLLMGKRKDTNKWTLPGGGVEESEDKRLGAIRELFEEAGIKTSAKNLSHLRTQQVTGNEGKTLTVSAYRYEWDGETVHTKNDPDDEVEKWEWIETKDGLPAHVKNNLNSPKNVVLQALGLIEDFVETKPHKYKSKHKGPKGEMIYVYKSVEPKRDFELFIGPDIDKAFKAFEDEITSEDIIKADRPGPHKYIRKYERAGRTVYVYEREGREVHRYSPEDTIKELLHIGDMLDGIDDATELNRMGMNQYDKSRWIGTSERIKALTHEQQIENIDLLRAILKKYKRQISGDEYELTGLADPITPKITSVNPARHPVYKTIQAHISGRVKSSDFRRYTEIHKEMGFTGRSGEGGFVWVLPRDRERGFDWDRYGAKLKEIGIELGEIPAPLEIPVAATVAGIAPAPTIAPVPVPEELKIDDYIRGINRRMMPNVLAIKRDETGKFSFHHQYDPSVVEFFKNRGGALSGIMEYNDREKSRETYETDLVREAIDKFKTKFPDYKIVMGGVAEAFKAQEEEQEMLKLPLPNVSAKLAPPFKLFPYQNEGVRALERADGNMLIGDEMGLGKTLQALGYVAGNEKRVLVVVPKVVRRTWIQEAEKFFPSYFGGHTKELVAKELRRDGMPDLTDVRIASINYESLEKFLPAIEAAGFDTIVIDESHRIKSKTAKITKTIQKIAPLFKHKILLSGTAVKNKKDELYNQIELVKPGLFTPHELKMGTIGGVWNKLKKNGVYIARQKKKVLTELPDKVTQITTLPVEGMPNVPKDIGEMSRAKITAALAKVPATVDFVNEIIDSSDSCTLVFSESKEAAEQIAAALGDVAILHHGEMSDDKREAAKAEFQNPDSPKRVFVSTRQSLAVGATLTRADKVVFNDLPWTAADLRQAEDRAHRVGQKNNVNVYWITAQDNPWDINLAQIVLKKYELNRRVNEGQQLTKEETEWMSKEVSLADIKAALSGGKIGPGEAVVEEVAKGGPGSGIRGHHGGDNAVGEAVHHQMRQPDTEGDKWDVSVDRKRSIFYISPDKKIENETTDERIKRIEEESWKKLLAESKKKSMKKGFELFINIHKSLSHKYIRKYRRGDKWIYVYYEADRKPRRMEDTAFKLLSAMAERGHPASKALIETIQEHDELKLTALRAAAKQGIEGAIEKLRDEYGIDFEEEKFENQVIPGVVLNRPEPTDTVEKKMTDEQRQHLHTALSEAVEQKFLGYLSGHKEDAHWKNLETAGIHTADKILEGVRDADSLKEAMGKLHENLKKVDEAHSGLTSKNDWAKTAGGYGNAVYNHVVKLLQKKGVLPEGYVELHARTSESRQSPDFKLPLASELEQIQAQKKREEEERRARARAEIGDSMAFFMVGIMEDGPSNEDEKIERAIKLNEVLSKIFKKNLKKEDWPYHFEGTGYTSKIKGMNIGSEKVHLNLDVVGPDGESIMDDWERVFDIEDGRPHIKNAYMATRPSVRGADVAIGEHINAGQRRLLSSIPGGGTITVTADISVGTYTWANQGFSFGDSMARNYASRFPEFLRKHRINTEKLKIDLFKEPHHFAAFDIDKRVVQPLKVSMKLSPKQIETNSLSGVPGEYPLEASEKASGQTLRGYFPIGKAFLIEQAKNGNHWSGVWDSEKDTEASRFGDAYLQSVEAAKAVLNEEYRAMVGEMAAAEAKPRPRRSTGAVPEPENPSSAYRTLMQVRPGTRLTGVYERMAMGISDEEYKHFIVNATGISAAQRRRLNGLRTERRAA